MMLIKDNKIEFKRTTDGFNYVFEGEIPANKTVFAKMPVVSANKRGINEIGWQCESDEVNLFGTMSQNPEGQEAIWSEIKPNYLVNKTISALKIENTGEACTLCLRVIMN